MYRFFVERSRINENEIIIAGQDAHHIKNVLRMKPGESIFISSGDKWEYKCDIISFEDGKVRTAITDIQKPGRELLSRITLYQCIPKREKMEQIIQKSVELGAYKIVPVESSRCVTKISPEKKYAKIKRWNAISLSAAKQAKRMMTPEVTLPLDFETMLEEASENNFCFIPYEKAEDIKATRSLFNSVRPGDSVGIIIGPEGGFSESEIEHALKKGAKAVTLGGRILRTETAACAVLAVISYLLE